MNYEYTKSQKIGAVAITLGVLSFFGGIEAVLAYQASLPTRHQLAVSAWNESNGALTALHEQIRLEKLKTLDKYCVMVSIAYADNIEVSADGEHKYKRDCFQK